MADDQKILTEEEITAWSRESYRKATSYLAEKGFITETVAVEQSSYLAPLIAVWKMKSTDGKWLWVISGDLPTDSISVDSAESARDAVRAFSLKWQLDCENLFNKSSEDPASVEFAQMLQSKANGLYQIFEQDEFWQS